MQVELGVGLATAVGSLPHVDAKAAAELALRRHPSLAAIPSLPMRSPWESMLGQAIAGLEGVTITDGRISLVGTGPALDAWPETDLDHDAFGGMRGFIEVAGRRAEPVKWQVTGPVTLGLGLLHAGLPATKAFAISEVAVTARVKALDAVALAAFPERDSSMVLDEPGLTGMAHRPLPARSVKSSTCSGVRSARPWRRQGIHCCGWTDWGVIDQAGPAVLSMPADHGAIRSGGALVDFLARGWAHRAGGAIPTDGPRADSVDRYWRVFGRGLVRARPRRLRSGALAHAGHRHARVRTRPHTVEQADQVLGLTQEIADRVLDQAVATRSLGA